MNAAFAGACGALILSACAVTTNAVREEHPEQAAQAFEILKSLAGRWHGVSVDERSPSIDLTYEVVSGGTVVMERLHPSSEHEMITMYHRDGPALTMTHYCSQGNQPRMRMVGFTAAPEPTLTFEFRDSTNHASPDELIMHGLRLSLINQDHLTTHWTAWVGGKPDHSGDFEFTRIHSLGY